MGNAAAAPEGLSLRDLAGEVAASLAATAPVLAGASRGRLTRRAGGAPAVGYHIPRLAIDLAVGVARTDRVRWLVKATKRTEELDTHIRLELISTPAPPPPLDGGGTGAGTGPARLTLGLPRFLVLERGEVGATVGEVLRYLARSAPEWRKVKRLEEKLASAARELAEEVPFGTTEDHPWEAAFVFRTGPETRLLCLVDMGKKPQQDESRTKGKRDAVFELHGEGPVPREVVAVTYPKDRDRSYPFAPLYRLLATLRGWERGRLPAGEEIPAGTGELKRADLEGVGEELRAVLSDMQAAYRRVRELADQAGYRVARLSGRLQAVMGVERRLLFSRQEHQLENTVELSVEQRRGELHAAARWSLPELILAGEAREEVLRAVEGHPPVRRELAAHGALRRRDRASVFLAPKGPAKLGYLVLWPGVHEGRPRDLVYYARLGRRRRLRPEASKVLFHLSQPFDALPGGDLETGEGLGYGDDYQPFHALFGAIAAWFGRFS